MPALPFLLLLQIPAGAAPQVPVQAPIPAVPFPSLEPNPLAPKTDRPAQDPVKHLGPVKPGETKTFEWEVKNTSARPVLFRLLDAPAAFTAPGLALAKPWAPGETRKVTLALTNHGLKGLQTWNLRLASDDPGQPPHALAVDCLGVVFGVSPDTITSLGSIGPKEVKTLRWELRNLADGPLTFRLLDLAPGVTVDMAPFSTPFAPGEARPIVMTLDPTGFVGYQRRAAKIECSDPSQPRYILRVDMTVRPELAVDGQAKDMGAVQRHESPSATFRFTREGGEAAAIKLVSALPDYFEHEIVQEGVNANLVLTLRPGRLRPGQTAGLERLQVTTSAPLQPRFNLTLAWRIKQLLEATPTRIVLDQPDALAQTCRIRRVDGKPFRIREAVVAEGRGWAVSGLGATEQAEHELTVKLLDRAQRKGMLRIAAEGVEEPLLVPLAYLPPDPPSQARPAAKPPEGAPAAAPR